MIEGYLERRIRPTKPTVCNTVYQSLNLTVTEQHENVAYLCGKERNLDPRIYTFGCDTLEEWWSLTGERWENICNELYMKRVNLANQPGRSSSLAKWISVDDYKNVKNQLPSKDK